MLIEMYSDAFKIGNEIRTPIPFHNGLNCVTGTTSADNSIGKSSFLLAVDFCFGGDYYPKSDAVSEIGNHVVKFTFQFNNTPYYFFRDTANPDYVIKCNKNYEEIKTITLKEYRDFLFDSYKMDLHTKEFGIITQRYFRVFNKDNYAYQFPLNIVPAETHDAAITALLKIFDVYYQIKELKDKEKKAKDVVSAYNKAVTNQVIIPSITTQKQEKEALKAIKDLETEIKALTDLEDKKILAMEIERNSAGAEINYEITKLRRYKYSLNAKIKQLKKSDNTTQENLSKNILKLSNYFENINLEEISKIESFHNSITGILSTQLDEEITRLNGLIKQTDMQIEQLNNNLEMLNIPKNISKTFMDKCFDLKRKMSIYSTQVEKYKEQRKYKNDKKQAVSNLKDTLDSKLHDIEKLINDKLFDFNNLIYNDHRKAPELHLKSSSSYEYITPKDGGTGSVYKSLILYDLAILYLTPVPCIAHDSFLFKNIGDEPLKNIIELYSTFTKQIFISFDKLKSFDIELQNIINHSTVITLGKGINSLYGYYWGIEDEQKTEL